MADPGSAIERVTRASSSNSVDVNEPGPSSYRPSPSPSLTSQSDDPDRDDDDVGLEDEEDFTDAGPSQMGTKERRNTLKARGSAALVPKVNSSEQWQISPATAQTASAATLPHEILLHIFKYVAADPPSLRSSLRVCKAWCLCGVELLWHRPSLQRISNLFKLIHILRREDQTFPYATFIRRINLSQLAGDLEDSLFSRLAVCNRLERITLTGCTQISDDMIANVLENCTHLVAVDFSEVSQLTDHSLLAIAQNCPRLQGINLTGCKQITSKSVAALAKACKLMRRVKLCGCELITDEALIALCEHCPVILEIDLINCPLITDTSVRKIWHNSFHMRELRLAQCGKLTDLAFPAPLSVLPGGSMFQATAGAPDSAPTSRGGSPLGAPMALQQHQGQGSDSFPTASTLSDAPLYGHLRAGRLFDHLRILDMTNCSTISDAAIEGIVNCVPRLRNLILAKCTRLTNESAYSIARLGKNLHYLHLGHVSNLTDRAVCHLARSCTRLRYIDLACCPQLTDLSVIELATNLPKLRRIGLVRVSNLTDQAIYSLVERYTTLERIHLSYCENITVPAIFWLLERLTRLTHLSLTGVPDFRHSDLQSMRRDPPREFNAHQRAAFCVYSGKGVHELRRFLQKAYSSSKPPFRELRPEVQAYWRQASAASQVRRFQRHHNLAGSYDGDVEQGSDVPSEQYAYTPTASGSALHMPRDRMEDVQVHPAPPLRAQDLAAQFARHANFTLAPDSMSMLATSAPSSSSTATAIPYRTEPNALRQDPMHPTMVFQSGFVPTFARSNQHTLQHSASGDMTARMQAQAQHPLMRGGPSHVTLANTMQGSQARNDGIAALATPPASTAGVSSWDINDPARFQAPSLEHIRTRVPSLEHNRAQGRPLFSWGLNAPGAAEQSPQPHAAGGQSHDSTHHGLDAHGDDIFVNAEEALNTTEPTPGFPPAAGH